MKLILIALLTINIFAGNYEIVDIFDSGNNRAKVAKKSKKVYKKRVKKVALKRKKVLINRKKSTTKQKKHKAIKDKKIIKKGALKSIYPNSSKEIISKKRAKLTIIIDDISHKYQLNQIRALPFKVTPSIFPPSKMNVNSQKLAIGLKHYMVHLPLQSGSRAMNRFENTLFVSDSSKKIANRVAEIKRLFPTIKFINNHTGSTFSKNYNKSKILYKELMKRGITFVDSRTIQNSKFKKISKEFNRRYYHNSHFIDNRLNVNSILKEIKRGISIARQNGSAIIIGHPHPQTFKALKLAKKYLKQVSVVYIDEL